MLLTPSDSDCIRDVDFVDPKSTPSDRFCDEEVNRRPCTLSPKNLDLALLVQGVLEGAGSWKECLPVHWHRETK